MQKSPHFLILEALKCNCRKKEECPLNGDGRKTSIIYKCDVTTPDFPKKVYIGLTEKDFKTRWNGHKQSLTNKMYKNSTSFSSYVWDFKDKHNIVPTLKWLIVKHAKSYTINARTIHAKLYVSKFMDAKFATIFQLQKFMSAKHIGFTFFFLPGKIIQLKFWS